MYCNQLVTSLIIVCIILGVAHGVYVFATWVESMHSGKEDDK